MADPRARDFLRRASAAGYNDEQALDFLYDKQLVSEDEYYRFRGALGLEEGPPPEVAAVLAEEDVPAPSAPAAPAAPSPPTPAAAPAPLAPAPAAPPQRIEFEEPAVILSDDPLGRAGIDPGLLVDLPDAAFEGLLDVAHRLADQPPEERAIRLRNALSTLRYAQRIGVDLEQPGEVAGLNLHEAPELGGPAAPLHRTLAPVLRLVGAMAGGAEELGAGMEDLAEAAGGTSVAKTFREIERAAGPLGNKIEALVPPIPAGPPAGDDYDSHIPEMYRYSEDDLAEMLGKPVYERIIQDSGDILIGIPELLVSLSGADIEGIELYRDIGDFAVQQVEQGRAMGRTLTAGAVGVTAYMLRHPADSFRGRPVSTLLVLAPIVWAAVAVKDTAVLRVLKKHPKLQAALLDLSGLPRKAAGKIAEGTTSMVDAVTELVGLQAQHRGAVTRWYQGKLAAMRSWLQETGRGQTDAETALIDAVIHEPERARREIMGLGEEAAGPIERGEVRAREMGSIRAPGSPATLAAKKHPILEGPEGTPVVRHQRLDMERRARFDLKMARIYLARDDHPNKAAALKALARRVEFVDQHDAVKPLLKAHRETLQERRRELQGELRNAPPLEAGKGARRMREEVRRELDSVVDQLKAVGDARHFLREWERRHTYRQIGVVLDRDGSLHATHRQAVLADLARLDPTEAAAQLGGSRAVAELVKHGVVEKVRFDRPMAVNAASPAYKKLIKPLEDRIGPLFPAGLAFGAPRGSAMRAVKGAARGGGLATTEVQAALLSALFEGDPLLRSPKFRKRLDARMKEVGFGRAERAALNGLFDEKARPVGHVFLDFLVERKGQEAPVMATADLILDTWLKLTKDKKARAHVLAEAFRSVVHEIAERSAGQQRKMMFDDELRRVSDERPLVGTNKGTPAALAQDLIVQVLFKKEPLPLNIGQAPEAVAMELRRIAGNENSLKAIVTHGKGTASERLGEQVARLAWDVESRYTTKPHPGLKNVLPSKAVAVLREASSDVGWHLLAVEAARDTSTLVARVMRSVKRALVPMNVVAHVNNAVSNLGALGVKFGLTPIEVFGETVTRMVQWNEWTRGTLKDPALAADFLRMRKLGVIDSTLVEGELGAAGLAGVAGASVEALRKLGGAFDLGYKWGDSGFKLWGTIRGLKRWRALAAELRPGESMVLRLDDKRTARISKRPDGTLHVTPVKGKLGPRMDAQDALVLAAAAPMQDVLFDYLRVPKFVSWARAAQLPGVVNPFLTWGWKALDIPFVKKGLISRVILEGEGIPLQTDSWAVTRSVAATLIASAGRKAALINGLRAFAEDADEELVKQSARYMPRGGQVVLLRTLTDPAFVQYKDLTHSSWAEPTEALFRVGVGAFLAVLGEDADALWTEGEADADTRERRKLWRKQHSGELWSIEDVLSIIGMSGHPVTMGVFEMMEAAEKGVPITMEKIARDFGGMLIGGTPMAVLDISAAAVNERSKLSRRLYSSRAELPEEVESFAAYVVRRLTGLGWRTAKVYDLSDWYFRRVERGLRGSLLGDHKRVHRQANAELEKAKAGGDKVAVGRLTTEIENIEAQMGRLEEIIGDSMGALRDDYEGQAARLGLRRRRRISAEARAVKIPQQLRAPGGP